MGRKLWTMFYEWLLVPLAFLVVDLWIYPAGARGHIFFAALTVLYWAMTRYRLHAKAGPANQ